MCRFSLALHYVYGYGSERSENGSVKKEVMRFSENGKEWRLSDLAFTGNLVLCVESEVGPSDESTFAEVYKEGV